MGRVSSGIFACKVCGESDKSRMMLRGQSRLSSTICKACHSTNTAQRAKRLRVKALAYKGSKCERCGYDKCSAALEFHHLDPATKDPSFNQLRFWGWDRQQLELDKCILVCSNCHREIHAGV